MEHKGDNDYLPNIMGHRGSDGCYEDVDYWGSPIFPEPYDFGYEERKEYENKSGYYWEFSYDDKGHCTMTKKLLKKI